MYGGNCYRGRDYYLFAVLAGVRSYRNIVPRFEPRGVPADASPMYKMFVAQDDGDWHSHSYLDNIDLLAALITYTEGENSRNLNCATFVEEVVHRQIDPLVAKYGDRNVRIVFHFDN